jgi:hypothetical protein
MKIDVIISNKTKINGNSACCIIPDKIIAATATQAISKRSEIIHKAADVVVPTVKRLNPPHPGITIPRKQKSVETLIIIRILISITRSLIDCRLTIVVYKIKEMITHWMNITV